MESRAPTRSLKVEEAGERGRRGAPPPPAPPLPPLLLVAALLLPAASERGSGVSSSEIALSAFADPSRGPPLLSKSLKCAARGAECEKSRARASASSASSALLRRAASPEKRSEGQ